MSLFLHRIDQVKLDLPSVRGGVEEAFNEFSLNSLSSQNTLIGIAIDAGPSEYI